MKNKTIPEQVHEIIKEFKTQELEITKGYKFNQYRNIQRINLYLNQRFLENSNPDAIFWDLSTHRIIHTAKNIDLDTKDLMPYAIGETNMFQVWLLRVKLRKWLREAGMAELLDDLTDGVAAFGSAVWKVVKVDGGKTLQEVDLKNLYFEQTAKNLKDVPVVEMHYLTPMEIKAKKSWDNVDKLFKQKPDTSNNYDIWEFWGETDDDEPKYMHVIGWGEGDQAIILFEEESDPKKFPYRDFHIGKYRGRWQRIGIVERLYKLQERANALVNQNAQATEIASLLLLRASDLGSGVNVLAEAENGQIISSTDLQQVGIDNRAFTTLLNELQVIEAQADKMCLTPDIVVGEALPSGTPFRSLATLANAAKSAFKSTRDRIASGLESILRDEILPDVVRNWQKGELVNIAEHEDDIKFYDDTLIAKRKIEALARGNRQFRAVTPEEIEAVAQGVEVEVEQVGRTAEIPKNYFNFDYGVRFMATAEGYDKQQQNDAMFNAISLALQNPAIVNIPLFKQYVENNGIEWWRLTPKEVQQIAQNTQRVQQPQQTGDKLSNIVDTQ